MKFVATLPLLAALVKRASGAGEGQWFSYFEKGGLGPSRWSLLQTPDNQCGGGVTESPFIDYGQSPVNIAPTECAGTFDYTFSKGDCSFNDLHFSISNNGVKVEPKPDSTCVFGKMQIPHFPEKDGKRPTFKGLQFHIHTSSEHTLDGGFFDAELHVVHAQESSEGVGIPYTVWGSMIQTDLNGGADHPVFEDYLRGWEIVANEQENICSSSAGGERARELAGQNKFVPVVDDPMTTGTNGCYTQKVGNTEWNSKPFQNNGTHVPDIYTELINEDKNYGSFTYKGGLTTPPCTQIVNWNVIDRKSVV